MKRFITLALLAALLVSCADDTADFASDQDGDTSQPTLSPTPSPTLACPDVNREPKEDDAGVIVEGTFGEAATVRIPQGEPDCVFSFKDIIVGDGEQVQAGAVVTGHYIGVSWVNRKPFDQSFGTEPGTFPLDRVIPGWQAGIPGMKVGGRRLLVIPPSLGYGPESPGPGIAGNDTLVFVIDVQAVQ